MITQLNRWNAGLSPFIALAMASNTWECNSTHLKRIFGTCSFRFRAPGRCAGCFQTKFLPKTNGSFLLQFSSHCLNSAPLPVFLVRVASKQLRNHVSGLESTLTLTFAGACVSVDSKAVREDCFSLEDLHSFLLGGPRAADRMKRGHKSPLGLIPGLLTTRADPF